MKHGLGFDQKSQKQWSLESHLGCWLFKVVQVADQIFFDPSSLSDSKLRT